MIKLTSLLYLIPCLVIFEASAQQRVSPGIPSYGAIYDIPNATVVADSAKDYRIVVDVYSGPSSPNQINPALNNVARMINLHIVSGAKPERINIVLALHASATYATLNDGAYRGKYGIENPNTGLIKELKDFGVLLALCGQSMIGRGVSADELLPEIDIATSMLTTVSTYQLEGYAVFKF